MIALSLCFGIAEALAAKPETYRRLTGHAGWVVSVAYSPDDQFIATGSGDKSVRLWDVASGKNRWVSAAHDNPVDEVLFSPDGELVASRSFLDDAVGLWNAATGKLRHRLQHIRPVVTIAFAPNGATLGTGSWDGHLRLWDVASGRVRHKIKSRVNWMAFSPGGQFIASAGMQTINWWDVTSGRLSRSFETRFKTTSAIAYSPDGRWVAIADAYGVVTLRDPATGRMEHTLLGFEMSAMEKWAREFERGIKGKPNFVWRGELYRRLEKDPKLREALTKERKNYVSRAVGALAFSPGGRLLAVGSDDKTVRVWDAPRGQLKFTLTGHSAPVDRLQFSPDGRLIASAHGNETSADKDPAVRIWDSRSGDLLGTLKVEDFDVRSIAFSSSSKFLAAGGCVERIDFRCDRGEILIWALN